MEIGDQQRTAKTGTKLRAPHIPSHVQRDFFYPKCDFTAQRALFRKRMEVDPPKKVFMTGQNGMANAGTWLESLEHLPLQRSLLDTALITGLLAPTNN